MSMRPAFLRKNLFPAAMFFLLAYAVLFLLMPRSVSVYDEGLSLTGAMRVLAGQLPHRDFYANYGPLEFYSFALIFKTFGQSVLVERLWTIAIQSATVVTVFLIVGAHCRRPVAYISAVVMILWLVGMECTGPTAQLPVELLTLLASALILRTFAQPVSSLRMAAAGVIVGTSALYRYDTGVALVVIHVSLLALAPYRLSDSNTVRIRIFATQAVAYLAGFGLVVLPALLFFLSRSSIQPFLHDIVVYPGRYYARSRRLPFPGIDLHALDQLGVYLPIAVLVVGIAVLLTTKRFAGEAPWKHLLVVFGSISFVMYFKGAVRVGLFPMYLSIVPATLIIAILFDNRRSFAQPLRAAAVALMSASMLLSAIACVRVTKRTLGQSSIPGRLIAVLFNQPVPPAEAQWCNYPNPVTRGFCFLPDNARIQTIEFIASHTHQGQSLYVGLDRHDKVFANDNLIYFATQRLPATKWSHFDPNLQNTLPVQTEMVGELQRAAPPYIALDSEFDESHEANDSSKSTGVLLLDDYLQSHYHQVEAFGVITVYARNP
jgi:hypothetical protein